MAQLRPSSHCSSSKQTLSRSPSLHTPCVLAADLLHSPLWHSLPSLQEAPSAPSPQVPSSVAGAPAATQISSSQSAARVHGSPISPAPQRPTNDAGGSTHV